MPIYQYKCDECNTLKEVIQKINDPQLKTCDDCKKDTLKKVPTSATFGFKGTGYYCTDFKHNK